VPTRWCRRTGRPTAAGTPHLLVGERTEERRENREFEGRGKRRERKEMKE